MDPLYDPYPNDNHGNERTKCGSTKSVGGPEPNAAESDRRRTQDGPRRKESSERMSKVENVCITANVKHGGRGATASGRRKRDDESYDFGLTQAMTSAQSDGQQTNSVKRVTRNKLTGKQKQQENKKNFISSNFTIHRHTTRLSHKKKPRKEPGAKNSRNTVQRTQLSYTKRGDQDTQPVFHSRIPIDRVRRS